MGSKQSQPKKADVSGMLEFSPVAYSVLVGAFVPLFPNRATVFLDPERGCHIWGMALREGYGAIAVHVGGGKKVLGAHVVSWERANGEAVGRKRVVRHSCDVRCCVNPEHLLSGTYRDNTMDAIARGRHKIPRTRWKQSAA